MKQEGECIVCGELTRDKSYRGRRWHWRCGDGEECAVRRNAKKARPRPESEIRQQWRQRQSPSLTSPSMAEAADGEKKTRQALKLPGRVYNQFIEKAQVNLSNGRDIDLCDVLSKPQIKARGRGWTVLIPMDDEQLRRLADWVGPDDTKLLRNYRKAILDALEAKAANQGIEKTP